MNKCPFNANSIQYIDTIHRTTDTLVFIQNTDCWLHSFLLRDIFDFSSEYILPFYLTNNKQGIDLEGKIEVTTNTWLIWSCCLCGVVLKEENDEFYNTSIMPQKAFSYFSALMQARNTAIKSRLFNLWWILYQTRVFWETIMKI